MKTDETTDLMDALELAWGLIANAHGGDWDKATPLWKKAAEQWRDEQWHPALKRHLGGGDSEVELCDGPGEDVEVQADNFRTAVKVILIPLGTVVVVVALVIWWLWPMATAFLG